MKKGFSTMWKIAACLRCLWSTSLAARTSGFVALQLQEKHHNFLLKLFLGLESKGLSYFLCHHLPDWCTACASSSFRRKLWTWRERNTKVYQGGSKWMQRRPKDCFKDVKRMLISDGVVGKKWTFEEEARGIKASFGGNMRGGHMDKNENVWMGR